MKTILAVVLLVAGADLVSVRAASDKLRAAVITQVTDAMIRTTAANTLVVRQRLEAGKVFELVSAPGVQPALKIDADRVATVPVNFLKIRECTKDELETAKAKFNALDAEAEHKSIQVAYKQKMASVQKSLCATCPKVRAAASKQAQEHQKTRQDSLKALEEKKQALLKEALLWAAAN